MENPKESPKDQKVPKAHAKGKTSKTGISGLENLKSETRIHDEWSPTAGVWMNGMMTGVLLDGMKVVNERMTHL